MNKKESLHLEWNIDKTVEYRDLRWLTKRLKAYPAWRERVKALGKDPEEVYRGLLQQRRELLDSNSELNEKSGRRKSLPAKVAFDESMAEAVVKLEAFVASIQGERRTENGGSK